MGVKLRNITEEDLPFLNETRNECREFLHDDREFTLEETKKWFANLEEGHSYLLIYKGGKKKPLVRLGYFRLKRLTSDPNFPCYEVGADISYYFRGQGYAKKAYAKLFKEFPHVREWSLEVLGTNPRAYTLYRELGFEVETASVLMEVRRGRLRIPSIFMVKNG